MLFRTYPRIPFYEQVHDNEPFYTDTGRLHAYSDVPEAIEYGENFIVHREGPEATPYLPERHRQREPATSAPTTTASRRTAEHWDDADGAQREAAVGRGEEDQELPLGEGLPVLLPHAEDAPQRPLAAGRNVDWHIIWDSNFGDPYRLDKRAPSVGEHQLHMNPQAARDLGIKDGDYVYVDANPADRPYLGAKPSDPFYKVARCMLRVQVQPAYPYNVVMMKHAPFIATERTVKAHETRPDGRAALREHRLPGQPPLRLAAVRHAQLAHADAPDRHALPQDEGVMGFIFGGEADNHAINTVPKETLVQRHQGRGRRPRRARRLEAGDHRRSRRTTRASS